MAEVVGTYFSVRFSKKISTLEITIECDEKSGNSARLDWTKNGHTNESIGPLIALLSVS